MHNSCDFFRYLDGYSDVFIEDDGTYLYVECEPWNWAHLLCCVNYVKTENLAGSTEWIIGEHSGCDVEYLKALKPAPEDDAKWIIGNEIIREAQARAIDDPEEWESWEDMTQLEAFETLEYC